MKQIPPYMPRNAFFYVFTVALDKKITNVPLRQAERIAWHRGV